MAGMSSVEWIDFCCEAKINTLFIDEFPSANSRKLMTNGQVCFTNRNTLCVIKSVISNNHDHASHDNVMRFAHYDERFVLGIIAVYVVNCTHKTKRSPWWVNESFHIFWRTRKYESYFKCGIAKFLNFSITAIIT